MSFLITYKSLFEVKIWHDYLLNKGEMDFHSIEDQKEIDKILEKYDIHQFLDIEPTYTCSRILKKHKMILRKTRYGFKIAIKVEEIQDGENVLHKPFVPWDRFFSMTFMIKIKNAKFSNITNLPQQVLRNSVYYFTNISTKKKNEL